MVRVFLSGVEYQASLTERTVAIVVSSLVLAICLWFILTQFTVSNKRRRLRRSTTLRSRPSYLSIRSGILAQAIATVVHAVLIITTASLNLLSNPVVSAARTTCMGENQIVNGVLTWERFLVVHPDYEVGFPGGEGGRVCGGVCADVGLCVCLSEKWLGVSLRIVYGVHPFFN